MQRTASRNGSNAGFEVGREDFAKSFLLCPKITITSIADVKQKVTEAVAILSKSTEDWTKRMNQLKIIRSLIIHSENVVDRALLIQQLTRLVDPLELSVKDLRSQVLREAAITCSFIMQTFGNDAHQIGEQILPATMSQVAVSTKIMATCASTLSSFIVQHVQTKQIFTTISSYSTSKDKNQRRQLSKLLEFIVSHWSEKIKKVYLRQICELTRVAICDADPEARIAGRRVFTLLEEMHSEEAEKLFQTLDAQKQKMLRSGDGGSSSLSVNSERGSTTIRSKLSVGSKPAIANISTKFLAQRSASALDTSMVGTPGSRKGSLLSTASANRYGRGATPVKSMSKVDTSPGGSKFARPTMGMGPRTTSNLRARTPLTTSQSTTRPASPTRRGPSALPQEMKRVKSNLGANSFVGSLTPEEAAKFQKDMQNIQSQLRAPSKTDDDEFLLPKRNSKTPQKSLMEISRVDEVLRACSSSSTNEKKEGIKMLSTIVTDPTLKNNEIKNIGQTLNRLLGDVTNAIVLEAISSFVQTHHSRLSEWLKMGLSKLIAKKGSEMVPQLKKQIAATLDVVLSSFDPQLQFNSICELMCDPVVLLTPKSRVVLLEYWNELLSKHLEQGSAFNNESVKKTIRKMFSWMSDERISATIMPYGEKVLCSLFALNAADFSALFFDFDSDYRDKAYAILQSHGHDDIKTSQSFDEEKVHVRKNIRSTTAQIEDFVGESNRRMGSMLGDLNDSSASSPRNLNSPKLSGPLRPLNSKQFGGADDDNGLNESFERLKLNSTTHLVDDTTEQSRYVSEKLEAILKGDPAEQHDALLAIQTMLYEGSFTLWEQNFAKLLIAIFDILSKSESDINKKLALRILTKMCTAQAARLFDSTEVAVFKVLDAVVSSKDGAMNVMADDCLKTLATHLPLAKIVNITKCIFEKEPLDEARAGLILKMATRLFEELSADELEPIVDEIAPCAVKAYDSQSASIRKSAVYCLVAMVNKFGMKSLERHLKLLPSTKLNLIQVYVKRTMATSSHSHV